MLAKNKRIPECCVICRTEWRMEHCNDKGGLVPRGLVRVTIPSITAEQISSHTVLFCDECLGDVETFLMERNATARVDRMKDYRHAVKFNKDMRGR